MLQCSVTNEEHLPAADTKFCIHDITTVVVVATIIVKYIQLSSKSNFHKRRNISQLHA